MNTLKNMALYVMVPSSLASSARTPHTHAHTYTHTHTHIHALTHTHTHTLYNKGDTCLAAMQLKLVHIA